MASVVSGSLRQQVHEDPRFELLDKMLKRVRYKPDALIEVIHSAQDIFGYLRTDVLDYLARALALPSSQVYGVATFYHLFSFKPKGAHSCTICMGTACYVGGAQEIVQELERALSLKVGETTADGQMSLYEARCLGSCGLAPVVLLDGEISGREGADVVFAKVNALLEKARETQDAS